jgi:AcrR family transcriptional regulator
MAEKVNRRRHPHLTRESIADTALALIDDEGVSALSLRNVAVRLGVGAMTLYYHTPGREAIIADVVGLLLDEVDLRMPKEADWTDCARQIARSLRSAALRHPRAWSLVAGAASDKPPLIGYARQVRDLLTAHGMRVTDFVRMWSVLDSFATGFLLLETQRINAVAEPGPVDAEDDLTPAMQLTLSEQAYEEGVDVILVGLVDRFKGD